MQSLKLKILLALSAVLLVGICMPCMAAKHPVLSNNFETDAVAAGWSALDPGWTMYEKSGIGTTLFWTDKEAHSGKHCLGILHGTDTNKDSGWVSPKFALKEQQYYSLTFFSKASTISAAPPLWAIFFYDANGKVLEGDHYSGLTQTTTWGKQEYCFSTKFSAVTATVALRSYTSGDLFIDDVSITPVTRKYVQTWANEFARQMPPMAPVVPADAGKLIPNTLRKLKHGGPVRIAILGDSIGNDLSNSPADVLIERIFPKAKLDMQFVGRGATGWGFFQEHVQERVIDHKPDLLIFLAISNPDEAITAPLQRIIDETRKALPATEFLIISPHINFSSFDRKKQRVYHGKPQRDTYQRFAAEQQIEFVDLLSAWEAYGQASGKGGVEWMQRDEVHMNEFGHQFTARVLAAYFAQAAKRK